MKRLFLLFAFMQLVGLAAFAYDFSVDGIYYNITSEDNLTVEITRESTTYPSTYTGDPFVIPATVTYNNKVYTVTAIGDGAFFNAGALTSVTIPNTVTSIGNIAFKNCYSITSITIPDNVTSIGTDAFWGCGYLTTLSIGTGVTSLVHQTFYRCPLNTITIAEGNSTYASIADNKIVVEKSNTSKIYMGCGGEVNIPSSITTIGQLAFWGRPSLTSITIPANVTSLEHGAFMSSGLTSITIPSTVTSVETGICESCKSLQDATYNASTTLLSGTFRFCDVLTTVNIGDNVTSISYQVFERSNNLATVNIGSGLSSIHDLTFYDCPSLTTITIDANNATYYSGEYNNAIIEKSTKKLILGCGGDMVVPSTVTSIGDKAFEKRTSLTSITIPSSVKSIGSNTFVGCNKLSKVIISSIADWCGITFGNLESNPLYYAEHLYSDATTEITEVVIPNSVTSIGNYAFWGCSYITSVEIPSSVKSIGSNTFVGCSNLSKVITSSITDWCDITFGSQMANPLYYAKHLYSDATTEITEVVIPNSVTSIGNYTFCGGENFTSISIPNTATSIGNGAFRSCKGITTIDIPNSVESIGQQAFDNCSNLATVYFFGNAPTIETSNTAITNEATVWVPLSKIDGYSSKISTDKLYPMLETGKMYRTFSFGKAVKFESDGTILGLNNPDKKLAVKYVSDVSLDNHTVTFSPATGEWAAEEGFIIEGTGVDDEYYPIQPATGTPAAKPVPGEEGCNYLEGNGSSTKDFNGLVADLSSGTFRYFIMKNGDFYYCTGGELAKYKCYLDLGETTTFARFNFVYEDETPTGINNAEFKEIGNQANGDYYDLSGRKVKKENLHRGIYIHNGRKVVVK